MKIKHLFFGGCSLVALLVLSMGTYHLTTLKFTVEPMTFLLIDDVYSKADILIYQSQLRDFRYYDEVLTQSTRNFAFTGDEAWKARYDMYGAKLDSSIKYLKTKGLSDMDALDEVNIALVDIETQAFASEENLTHALDLLNGEEYHRLKEEYAKIIEPLMKELSLSHEDHDSQLHSLSEQTKGRIDEIFFKLVVQGILTLVSCITLMGIFGYYIFSKIIDPIESLTENITAISKGKLDTQIGFTFRDDEIGDLARAFERTIVSVKLAMKNMLKPGEKT